MKEEVEELMGIINKGSHSSHTFRVSYILLNCDEGEFSEKATRVKKKQDWARFVKRIADEAYPDADRILW